MEDFQNTLFTNDNLFVLHGLNSEIADLIYLDPPFNSKRMYSAPVGSKSAGASFKDMWTWDDVNEGYLETLAENFRNEIVWCYTGPSNTTFNFPKKHDVILRYSKSDNYLFLKDEIRISYKALNSDKGKKAKIWGEVGLLQNEEIRKQYLAKGKVPEDWWIDIPSGGHISPKERTGYPTQKPLALLERIIKASSKEGDVVLDPFCGCATTCVSAQFLNRKWIGIDIAEQSASILLDRLTGAGAFLPNDRFVHRLDVPKRTDVKEESDTNPDVKKRLFKEQEGKCNGCDVEFEIRNFEVDHIVPKAKGGGDYYENYQLLCGNCNRTKGARPMEYLRAKIKSRKVKLKLQFTFGE